MFRGCGVVHHVDKCLEEVMWPPCRQMFRGGGEVHT